MKESRIFDLLDRFKANPGTIGNFKLGYKDSGEWKGYSTEEYINIANKVSYGLLALGIKKGDKIATITNNRPEWNFMDMGIAQIGAVHVPIHPTLTSEELVFILNHSEAKMVLVSDKTLFKKISEAKSELPLVDNIYTFNQVEGASHWSHITSTGQANAENFKEVVLTTKEAISDDTLLTIIYTSGTTGNPKA